MTRAITHRPFPRRSWPVRSLIAVGALSALLLAGCGSSGSGTTSTQANLGGAATGQDRAAADGAAPGVQSAPDAKGIAPGAPTAGSSGPADTTKSGVPAVGPKLTKNASLDLRVKEVAAAAAKVRAIAAGLQAQVLSEQIGTGDPGGPVPLQEGSQPSIAQTGFGTLTLSVPADKLDTALDQLGGQVGTVLRRNTSSQDVTAQYVDTQSRLKTMRASVDRVRALMTQAKDLGQVVALESELSRRQADLESLEAQMGALNSSVERSTLTVTLSTPGNEPVTSTGFFAGLRAGWDAFTASASGLLTAIGAALPFAAFFALIAAATIWWLRRRKTSATNVSPQAPPEQA